MVERDEIALTQATPETEQSNPHALAAALARIAEIVPLLDAGQTRNALCALDNMAWLLDGQPVARTVARAAEYLQQHRPNDARHLLRAVLRYRRPVAAPNPEGTGK